MEQWKPIKNYEGYYEVSNTGRVRSLNYRHTGKIKELKPRIARGYLMVTLCKEGITKSFSVHRLVVETFIGEIPEGMVVNHKDECKTNNNVDNLEICTNLYNINYGTRNQRTSESQKGKIFSKEHRRNLSIAKMGHTAWNKGKTGVYSIETLKKMSESRKKYLSAKD